MFDFILGRIALFKDVAFGSIIAVGGAEDGDLHVLIVSLFQRLHLILDLLL